MRRDLAHEALVRGVIANVNGRGLGHAMRVDTGRWPCPHCRRFPGRTRGTPGFPDLVVARPGFLGLELKTGAARLNEAQVDLRGLVRAAGGTIEVVRTVEDALYWIGQSTAG